MKFYVGITDTNWFNFLRGKLFSEVNFWRPSAAPFHALPEGGPFLFRLHAPNHFIVGGGFFVRYVQLPLQMAWTIFEEGNGAPDYRSLVERITHHRASRDAILGDIGCIVLTSPFFLQEADWIPVPASWQKIYGPGQGYQSSDPPAAGLWDAVQAKIREYDIRTQRYARDTPILREGEERYGSEYLVRSRLGQPGFRAVVTDAYQKRCAISGEKTLPVLEAAHIRPYAEKGPHALGNGLLLRADLHILFDKGYLTVTKDLRVEVSPRIKKEFENGRDYYQFHGVPLNHLPTLLKEQPDPAFLEWHNTNKYNG